MMRAEFVLDTKMMRYATHVADVQAHLKGESLQDPVTLKSLRDEMDLEVRNHTKSCYTVNAEIFNGGLIFVGKLPHEN